MPRRRCGQVQGHHRPSKVTTALPRLPPDSQGHHRPPKVTTALPRSPRPSQGRHGPPKVTTSLPSHHGPPKVTMTLPRSPPASLGPHRPGEKAWDPVIASEGWPRGSSLGKPGGSRTAGGLGASRRTGPAGSGPSGSGSRRRWRSARSESRETPGRGTGRKDFCTDRAWSFLPITVTAAQEGCSAVPARARGEPAASSRRQCLLCALGHALFFKLSFERTNE